MGWNRWRIEGQVIAHLGRHRFRLCRLDRRYLDGRAGEPPEVVLTLHPAAPPPLPPVGSRIEAECWRGALMVICESWRPLGG